MSRVDLRIEELVLDGVDPADGEAVAQAVEQEAARGLRERGLPVSPAQALGLEVARAVGESGAR